MEVGTLLNSNIAFWDGQQKVDTYGLNNSFFYGIRYEVALGHKSLVGNLLRKLHVDL